MQIHLQTPCNAVKLGAEGIGLCRTEHMFFGEERIPKIRKMILSETVEARESCSERADRYSRKADFKAMYEALEGKTDDRSLSGSAAS